MKTASFAYCMTVPVCRTPGGLFGRSVNFCSRVQVVHLVVWYLGVHVYVSVYGMIQRDRECVAKWANLRIRRSTIYVVVQFVAPTHTYWFMARKRIGGFGN